MLIRPGGMAPVARAPIVVPAAPATPAMAARWGRVSVPGIRVAAPDRLLAAVAPAEQPALTAAALVGRLGKLLEHAVQAVEVGHQAAAALRRLVATRRLAGVGPLRIRSVGTVPVGTPPGAGPAAATACFRFVLDGARDDPAPAGPSLGIRIHGLGGRASRADRKRAPRRLRRRGIPPCAIAARRPGGGVPAPSIPAS